MPNQISAIKQAQRMFEKLVNAKISRPPMPRAQIRPFQVATLANGWVLLSNGQTRQSFPAQRAEQIQQTGFNTMQRPQDIKQNVDQINMEINTPAKELAMGGVGGNNYFVNLLATIMQQKLKGSPELMPVQGLPDKADTKLQDIAATSAFANLPKLGEQTKSLFEDNAGFYSKFMSNTGTMYDAIAKDFLDKYNNRQEQPVGMQPQGGRQIPLTADYKSRFGLPAGQNARYAQITNNVNALNKRI